MQNLSAGGGKVRRAFQRLWDPRRNLDVARRSALGRASCAAIHANILAPAYGLAPPTREASVLAHVRAVTSAPHTLPEERVELHFVHVALIALADRGLAGACANVLHSRDAIVRERGAWSPWECLERGLKNQGCLCHGWSCSPNIHWSLCVLDVHPPDSGNLDVVRRTPLCDTLDRAEGGVPHRGGWGREGRQLVVAGARASWCPPKSPPEAALPGSSP